jgi:hypothetical protein
VGVPRGTPPEIIERLNREINAGLVNPTIKARLVDVATTPIFFTPAEFGAYMAAEVEKWGKVIRASGIRPELDVSAPDHRCVHFTGTSSGYQERFRLQVTR